MKQLAILILNWNGGAMLFDCVQSIGNASDDIFIVDNDSEDSSVAQVRQQFPDIRVIQHEKNFGFAEGYNKAFEWVISNYEFIYILNNDTLLSEKFIDNLKPFLDELSGQVGMVATRMYFNDGKSIDNLGITVHPFGFGFPIQDELETLTCPSGGSAIYRTAMLKDLHWVSGEYFDSTFEFYNEDVDLGLRARLRKWQVVRYEYGRVIHLHSASMKKRSSNFSLYYHHRNQLWVYVKNFPTRLLLTTLIPFLLSQLAITCWYLVRSGGFAVIRAKIAALFRLPTLHRKRQIIQRGCKLSVGEFKMLLSQQSLLKLWKS